MFYHVEVRKGFLGLEIMWFSTQKYMQELRILEKRIELKESSSNNK